jgi:hypothetical protein
MKKEARVFLPPKFTSLFILFTLCVLSLGFKSCSNSNDPRKQFTAVEVSEIQAALKDVDPATYRVVLPRYENDRRVGSQTLGTLSVADVRRVASRQGLKFKDNGNLQAIFMEEPGSETTDKPSAQTPGKKPDGAAEFSRRLEAILVNKDRSKFILIR